MAVLAFGVEYTPPAAITALLVGSILFVFGVRLGGSRRQSEDDSHANPVQSPLNVRAPRLAAMALLSSVASLSAAASTVVTNGFAIGSLTTAEGFFRVGNGLAVNRYGGDLQATNVYVPLLLCLAYAGALVSPFLGLTQIAFRRTLILLPACALSVYSLVTTARLGFLIGIFMTFAGYLGMRVMREGRLPAVRPRAQLWGVAGIFAVVLAFWAIGTVRLGHADAHARNLVNQRMENYIVGSIPAFGQWFPVHALQNDGQPLRWGANTIAGANLLDKDGELLVTRGYQDRVVINASGMDTNVYTIYRGLIQDFGIPGTALALVAAGWAAGRAHLLAVTRRSGYASALLACSYTIVLFSTIHSIILFSSVLGAMAVAVFVVGSASRTCPEERGSQRRVESARPRAAESSKHTSLT